MNKPRDLLEFFRRTSPAEPEGAPAPSLQPTTRMLVLRRSQVIVASAVAVAALLLAFLVGHAFGSAGAFKADVYVIRAAEYGDDEKGQGSARKLKEQLEKMDLGDEVHFLRGIAGELCQRGSEVIFYETGPAPDAESAASAARELAKL